MTTVRDGGMAISRKISSAALDPRQVQRVGHTAGVPPTPGLCTFAPRPRPRETASPSPISDSTSWSHCDQAQLGSLSSCPESLRHPFPGAVPIVLCHHRGDSWWRRPAASRFWPSPHFWGGSCAQSTWAAPAGCSPCLLSFAPPSGTSSHAGGFKGPCAAAGRVPHLPTHTRLPLHPQSPRLCLTTPHLSPRSLPALQP